MKRLPEALFLVGLVSAGAWLYQAVTISEPYIGDKLAAENVVKMYSLTTCGFCAEKRRRLVAAGIPFTEYFIDEDQDRLQELMTLLESSNVVSAGIGTPTFTVNDVLLVNNPSMDSIKKYLKFKDS